MDSEQLEDEKESLRTLLNEAINIDPTDIFMEVRTENTNYKLEAILIRIENIFSRQEEQV